MKKEKVLLLISAIAFGSAALIHAFRILLQAELIFGTRDIPFWISGVIIVVSVALGLLLLKSGLE